MLPAQVFLLSPASCSGRRAALLLNERAQFSLAVRLRNAEGVPLGEVFSFLSGLYFRGKLTYARAFARPPADSPGVLIVTAGRGLLAAETPVHLADIRAFATVPIEVAEPRYREPLTKDATALAKRLPVTARAILLGSIATSKYVGPLLPIFGERLMFPQAFIGKGDKSRGAMLLNCVDDGRELDYVAVAGQLPFSR